MRRKRKLTLKVLEARMQDILNEPTSEDLERLRQFEEHIINEQARAIFEQEPHGKWRLDRESRKNEVAKILAEWNNTADDIQENE